MEFAIRVLAREDVPCASEVLRDAFDAPRRNEADLARYLALQPGGWLLASVDGVPAGVVGAMDYGRFAYVGMLGVRRDMQRRGVARALFRHLIDRLDGSGPRPLLLDATPAGEELYRSFGFAAVAETVAYERAPDAPAPIPELPPVRADMHGLDSVACFDAPIFGASRQALLGRLAADFPGRAFVTYEDGRIAGFLVAQPKRIGPWVARRHEVAEALLRSALALPYEGSPSVLVGSENAAAAALLARYGFRRARVTRHMIRGTLLAPRRRELIYGQTSFAVG